MQRSLQPKSISNARQASCVAQGLFYLHMTMPILTWSGRTIEPKANVNFGGS